MVKIKAFDDVMSWLHFAYALVLAIVSPIALVAASIIYYGYQNYEKEKWERKRGDFVEWLTGLLLGALIRVIVCGGVCICPQ